MPSPSISCSLVWAGAKNNAIISGVWDWGQNHKQCCGPNKIQLSNKLHPFKATTGFFSQPFSLLFPWAKVPSKSDFLNCLVHQPSIHIGGISLRPARVFLNCPAGTMVFHPHMDTKHQIQAGNGKTHVTNVFKVLPTQGQTPSNTQCWTPNFA